MSRFAGWSPARSVVALLALNALATSRAAVADNWPNWRGPSGTGTVATAVGPIEFGAPDSLAWTVDLPGLGASTPAVWGDAIVLTCAIDGKNAVVCYGLDGQPRWERKLGQESPAKHRDASPANPSPAIDGERAIAYFKSGDLAAFDLDGNLLWEKNLQQTYGDNTLWWDLGTSPVLVDGKVVVAVMQEGDSFLVALDVASGDEMWKTARKYERPRESDQAYTTPQAIRSGDRTILVTWGADHLTGHDAATGELVWDCGGFNPNNEGMWRVIASAAIADGVAVVPYGRGNFVAGVKLDGRGDVTATHRVWQKEGIGADVPTPAIVGDRAYVLGDQGKLVCLAVATGEVFWQADLPRSRHKFYSSPLVTGDLLYATRIDGTVFVGRISDEGFEQLAENALDDHVVATPVPVPGGVLFRGNQRLVLAKGPSGK
ncbi:MAG: PQQ-like beta-propeller repeat protein [Pirellulales bacterium]|nr:PQQ-like beta-propeller repeat protein [Pirellulales bacterium]